MVYIRFVNLMGGHIWIESEGLGKGSKVAFLVKLGLCNNTSEPTIQHAVMQGRAHRGSGDLIGHRLFTRDEYIATYIPRNQRSF